MDRISPVEPEDEERDMDLFDLVEQEEVVFQNGHFGIVDTRGFHEAPEPSLAEEIKRDPVSAEKNRRARAKIYRESGNIQNARRMEKEARTIAKYRRAQQKGKKKG